MHTSALTGVKIVDLSRVFAGPFCTQVLADHGAEVLKIEPPQGDETRDWGCATPLGEGVSSYFWGLNRNKKSVSLDLSRMEARQLLLRLLEDADVLVENFKQGTMQRWGLGYEEVLQAQFPKLVYLNISGYGDEGPLAGSPGYDAVAQAFCGLMSVNGAYGGEATKLPLPLVDMTTGLYASSAIAFALLARARTGLGQRIDMALYDVALSMLHPLSAAWQFSGKVPKPSGNVYEALAPYGLIDCADRAIYVGAGNNHAFAKLCAVLGLGELTTDARFVDNRARVANRAELIGRLSTASQLWQGAALAEALMQNGVAAAVVQNVAEVFHHPQTSANAMWPQLLEEQASSQVVASPIKMQLTPARLASPAPEFAKDTQTVFSDLGLTEMQIAGLVEAGIVHTVRK